MVNSAELKAYMARRGKTLKALAEDVETSPATLSRWLEKADMPVSYAEKIGKALDIPREEWGALFFSKDVA